MTSRKGLVVLKFGGTSMATTESRRRVVEIVTREHLTGRQLVIVVSAAAGETDRLIGETESLGTRHRAVSDFLLATGEQASAARLVAGLLGNGILAEPFTGARAGLLTDSNFGKARIIQCNPFWLEEALNAGVVPVVTGFQGCDEKGRITTLGRGGSDTSAVAIAAALKAEECYIYTDVDGIYTADPRIEPQARRLDRLHCEEMLELAGLGSNVLALESVEYAANRQVPLRVLSTFDPGPGTQLIAGKEPVHPELVGIASSNSEAEVMMIGLNAGPSLIATLLQPLARARIPVDTVVQNEVRQGQCDVSLTLHQRDLPEARHILAQTAGRLGAQRLVEDASVAKVSLVGHGLRSNTAVMVKALAGLEQAGINPRVVVANETRLSVLVASAEATRAVRTWHSCFSLGQRDWR